MVLNERRNVPIPMKDVEVIDVEVILQLVPRVCQLGRHEGVPQKRHDVKLGKVGPGHPPLEGRERARAAGARGGDRRGVGLSCLGDPPLWRRRDREREAAVAQVPGEYSGGDGMGRGAWGA